MVEMAKADLAQRLGIDVGSITVDQARAVTWRSGALGCPEPGMMYTQALLAGALMVLRVGDERFDYHAGPGGQPFLCKTPESYLPIESPQLQ